MRHLINLANNSYISTYVYSIHEYINTALGDINYNYFYYVISWWFFIISLYLINTLPRFFIAIKTSPFAIMIGRAIVPAGDERLANP